jgi:hypothetical protein
MDAYSESVDSLKITNYGLYMYEYLAYYFTYLDLICTDTAIYDEKVANVLSEAARKEYSLFTRGERVERVKVRLDRVSEFISYLRSEEEREREHYLPGLPDGEMFSIKSETSFASERERVMASARRQQLPGSSRRRYRMHH